MAVEKHVSSTEYLFVAIVGYGTPSVAEIELVAPGVDPSSYVAAEIVTDVDPLWDMALQAYFGITDFGLNQATPDYFVAARSGPFAAAPLNPAAGDFNTYVRLTIGDTQPVFKAPEAYVVLQEA